MGVVILLKIINVFLDLGLFNNIKIGRLKSKCIINLEETQEIDEATFVRTTIIRRY